MRTLHLNGTTFEMKLGLKEVSRFDVATVKAKGHDAPGLTGIMEAGRVDYWDMVQLFLETVRGQHGITTHDEAADFLDRHATEMSDVTRALIGCVNDLFGGVESEDAPGKSEESREKTSAV